MGFLDNTGDIILDIVLTDHGRMKLSRGDGSFVITKFALGDEEIDYSLYNSVHASGSSYYDLEILQTPILEAFTDNAASMKSKLATYTNMNLLYLPVMLLNELDGSTKRNSTTNSFIVAVDAVSEDDNNNSGTLIAIGVTGGGVDGAAGSSVDGILFGNQRSKSTNKIRIDTGLNTTALSNQTALPADINETQYTIQIDSRFGFICDPDGNEIPSSYVDDDGIAFYTISNSDDNINKGLYLNANPEDSSPISGPKGSSVCFKIGASFDLQTSTYLFNQLGSSDNNLNNRTNASQSYKYIDTIVRVSGMNNGMSIDIPVRFAKVTP